MRYPLAVLSVVGLLISSLLYGQDELKPADPLAKTQNIQEQHKPERKPAANGTNKTQADTSAEKNDEQQTAEDNNDEQQNATNEKATEATDKIQVFFEELDDVMAGPAKFAMIVKGLKSELKEEYQQNEKQLLGANVRPKDRSEILEGKQIKELEDRQKVIVQCYIDLTNRASSNNPRERMDLHSKIRERFREFRRENPTLASDARIGKKEQELMQQAMQRGMGFGRTTQQTLVETMRNLSANGDVAVAINALVPVESVSSLAHPGEQQGPIQEQRRGIQSILKLKWKGKNLSIDQEHWDDMFARMTVDGVHAKVDTMLEQKGAMLEEKRREHHPMHMALDATNVERLFHELARHQHSVAERR